MTACSPSPPGHLMKLWSGACLARRKRTRVREVSREGAERGGGRGTKLGGAPEGRGGGRGAGGGSRRKTCGQAWEEDSKRRTPAKRKIKEAQSEGQGVKNSPAVHVSRALEIEGEVDLEK